MKKIQFIIALMIIAISFNACYKEKDRGLDIYNNGEDVVITPPDTVHSPCDNTITLNTFVMDYATVSFDISDWYDHPNIDKACIRGRKNYYNKTLYIFFGSKNKPTKSTIYNITNHYTADKDSVYITYKNGGYSAEYYLSDAQGQLYLNILGDSVSATFCNVTFSLDGYPSIKKQADANVSWKK